MRALHILVMRFDALNRLSAFFAVDLYHELNF